jgi:hypothetical protein
MIGTLRDVNEELLHAHEAMARPLGALRPDPRGSTTGTGAIAPGGTDDVAPRGQAPAAEGGKPAA